MEFIQLGADPTCTRVRLPNPDTEVRRIFRLARLLEVFQNRKMVLASPREWDDPREDFAALCLLSGEALPARKGQQQPLAAYLASVWGQCWSLNPGSDTLLRAYSRVERDSAGRNGMKQLEGVTVKTSIQHLLSACESWHEAGADCHFIVGQVEYLSDLDIAQQIVNACDKYGPEFFRTLQGRATPLLQKRAYFQHEQEVRLLLVSRLQHRAEKFRSFKVDPNQLFLEVSFDPRLSMLERREREAELRGAGYTGPIVTDENYQTALFEIQMDRDWIEP